MDSKTLPKVELHCHLAGVLDPRMGRAIKQKHPEFPVDIDALEQVYPVHGFDGFMRWFHWGAPAFKQYFAPIAGLHIERLKSQNVCYSEIMVGGGYPPQDTSAAIERFTRFQGAVQCHESESIQVELLAIIERDLPRAAVERWGQIVLALHELDLIAGVAVVGPEQGNPIRPFRRVFAELSEAGVGIEVHAGEWCGPESVWDALHNGYPARIGHGISAFESQRLVDAIRQRDIHIEMCPTSNIRTGSVTCIEEHPIQRARELDLNFSINTDDPGLFECSMESEYSLLSQVFDFRESDFQRIYANSLEARFQSHLRIESV